MRTHNIPLIKDNRKDISILLPDPALRLTLTSSNYPCLEHIFLVPQVFELLKFDCIIEETVSKTSTKSKKAKKPWFIDDCINAIKQRKGAVRQFNTRPTNNNLNNYFSCKSSSYN